MELSEMVPFLMYSEEYTQAVTRQGKSVTQLRHQPCREMFTWNFVFIHDVVLRVGDCCVIPHFLVLSSSAHCHVNVLLSLTRGIAVLLWKPLSYGTHHRIPSTRLYQTQHTIFLRVFSVDWDPSHVLTASTFYAHTTPSWCLTDKHTKN